MKKICLLFACAGLITFTANAQEKKTKEPVKGVSVERPAPVSKPAPVTTTTRVNPTADRAPVAETTPAEENLPVTKPMVKPAPPKRQAVKYKTVNAVTVPATKAGAAK